MITTNRTIIRSLEKKDFDSLLQMYLEPDSNKFVAPFRDKPKEFFETYLQKKIEQNKSELEFWVAEAKDSNELLGTVNLNYFTPLSIFHIGCHLKTEYWNHGFATELLQGIIQYGIEIRKLSEIHGIVETENLASKKLMGKLGLELDRVELFAGSELEIYKLGSVKKA